MKLPNLAVDVKHSDFEWEPVTPVAEVSEGVATVQPETISAEELAANIDKYIETLMSKPNWREELLRQNEEKKRARIEARRQKRKAA